MARGIVLNERIASIPASASLSITSRAKKLAAEGADVLSLAAGEPDFDTPEHIKEAAHAAMSAGATKYAPVAGLPALREAIAAKLVKDNGLACTPEQVVVSDGAKHSLFNLFMALCRPGDEVVIPSPYWLSYPEMVKIAGGKPVFVGCREENDFKMMPADLEQVVTDRTRAIVLNTPSNPIGVAYSGEELAALGETALKHGLLVIADEVYEKIVYDGFRQVSLGSLSPELLDRTITVNGFSKAYAMTGWRLGYLAGPAELVKAVCALQSHSTSGANTFAQHGAVAALTGPQACIADMAAAFGERRAYLYSRLVGIEGATCVKPQGAFYMFPNVSAFGMDSTAFAGKLLDEEGVAVVPGVAFGADGNIRVSYACEMATLQQAMDRLERFVAGL